MQPEDVSNQIISDVEAHWPNFNVEKTGGLTLHYTGALARTAFHFMLKDEGPDSRYRLEPATPFVKRIIELNLEKWDFSFSAKQHQTPLYRLGRIVGIHSVEYSMRVGVLPPHPGPIPLNPSE